MTRPINTDSIATGTGRSWEEWLVFLRSIGAQALTHKEIAQRIVDTGHADGWWAQTITVAFEQHIGRRMPGQRSDGDFQVSVSKTLEGGMDHAFARWLALVDNRFAFDEIPVTAGPESSTTEKWRYWRATLADGSRIVAQVHQKSAGKAGFTLNHEKLDSAAGVAQWRAFWRGFLSGL